ncbi:HNH endonuclease signature motif containing protein [Natribacillus halophilus]|uniref:HNH endonuclease n=1 Tax=Natribacillus halophilus TaxID=549003 RepID=A0A1G8RU28_9BACI|nr:HNH endonuclease signature motif containing protein [Natribacillus halophilus]SDJ20462.1 HNH endonuclease [Natribacillus halophilus]
MHRYTKEQIDFLRSISEGLTNTEIHKLFVEAFSADVSEKSIQNIRYRKGIKNNMQGHETRFKKGHKTWNKNMKGINLGGQEGWFKKGHMPPSHLPVGSESVQEGEVLIKTDEPNVWEKKHRWLWEKHYGDIPDGHAISFKDGNSLNVTLDNLFAVNQIACMYVAKRDFPRNYPSINVASHRLAELNIAIRQKEKV